MASRNPEGQEAVIKKPRMPVKDKANLPAVLLSDYGMKEKHLLQLPAGDRIDTMNNKTQFGDDHYIVGSVDGGWLILYRTLCPLYAVGTGDEDCFVYYNHISFLNLVSGTKLNLPPEPCFIPCHSFRPTVFATVVTSDSSVPPDSPEFMTVAYFLNSNRQWLAFCRVQDKSWTNIADVMHACHAEAIVQLSLALDDKEKLLYYMHYDRCTPYYDVTVFDLKDPKNITKKILVMVDPKPVLRKWFVSEVINKNGIVIVRSTESETIVYLAVDSSCGDLFMVFQINDTAFVPGFIGEILPVKTYRVFKLEEGGPQWKEIDDLGDRSIFVSHWGSRMISTAKLNNCSQSEELIRGNCIYFALQSGYATETSSRRDIGVFSLTDKSIKHYPLPSRFQKNPAATLWFNPS